MTDETIELVFHPPGKKVTIVYVPYYGRHIWFSTNVEDEGPPKGLFQSLPRHESIMEKHDYR